MSPNPYPLFSITQSDKPSEVKAKIKMLTMLYIRDPDTVIALAVSSHIARLLAFPKYINDAEQRCKLRELEMHWQCLAWNNSGNIKGNL